MTVSCPCCGISIQEQVLRCPLCDTSLVRSNLRRALLWAFVVEEYALVLALVLGGAAMVLAAVLMLRVKDTPAAPPPS